ncbi:hypothetical protein D3C87_1887040 [compost metagenome]
MLQFTVAEALFGKLQLQDLPVAPELIYRANLRRNLWAERIHPRGIHTPLDRVNFGIGKQNAAFETVLPGIISPLVGLRARRRW